MKTSEIREKLHLYIETAEEKKLKAIYSMVVDEVEPGIPWNYKTFLTEMDRRIEELESGKTKGYTWKEVRDQAAQAIKSVKGKK
jgi:hypothetical protein